VPITIAAMLIHEIILMAFVDFFALKYRQANRKCKPLVPLKGELVFIILYCFENHDEKIQKDCSIFLGSFYGKNFL
jgi:hypothetical protein